MYGKYVSQYFKNSSRIHEIFSMNPKNISIKLQATANDLYDVLHDRSVENIVLIWHANYTAWSSRSWAVDAYDISLKATDHLKKWYFINAWCALITNDMFFPLWSFCVSDWKKLWWAQKWRRMWFDDIKKHKFYSHPVYLDEYLIYYEMMWDDIYDIFMEEYKYLANFENSKNNIVSHTNNKKVICRIICVF
jgi:hypothetical protein